MTLSEPVRRDAHTVPRRVVRSAATMALGVLLLAASARREIPVSARRYVFTSNRIEIDQDDLVKISFTAKDIPHSFTVDAYRIAKRAGAGQTVTFEFRADEPGTFPFYCNLAIDEGCREMHGELVVRTKP